MGIKPRQSKVTESLMESTSSYETYTESSYSDDRTILDKLMYYKRKVFTYLEEKSLKEMIDDLYSLI